MRRATRATLVVVACAAALPLWRHWPAAAAASKKHAQKSKPAKKTAAESRCRGIPGDHRQPPAAGCDAGDAGGLDVADRRHARPHRSADRRGRGAGGAGRLPAHHRKGQGAPGPARGAGRPDARQLQKLLLGAAESPGTIPDVVAHRVEAEAHQSSILDGYTFCTAPTKNGGCASPITANQIDNILAHSRDLSERLRVWTASKEIGRPLKPGLVELVKLRNRVARELGYRSYFALQVADYGMTRRRDDAPPRRHAGRYPAALRQPALLREVRAGRPLSPAAAPADSRSLAGEPLGAGLAGADRGRPTWTRSSTARAREHGEERGELLRVARVPAAAAQLLGAVGPVPGPARRGTQEEHARLGLGHRPRPGTCGR